MASSSLAIHRPTCFVCLAQGLFASAFILLPHAAFYFATRKLFNCRHCGTKFPCSNWTIATICNRVAKWRQTLSKHEMINYLYFLCQVKQIADDFLQTWWFRLTSWRAKPIFAVLVQESVAMTPGLRPPKGHHPKNSQAKRTDQEAALCTRPTLESGCWQPTEGAHGALLRNLSGTKDRGGSARP